MVRFSDYKDALTKTRLIGGCMPAYDRSARPAKLIGVTCMDINIVIDIDDFVVKEDYPEAREKMLADSKTCSKAPEMSSRRR